ncbi:MAG: transposase [Fimbriimonadaceae bacterium]
MKGHRRWQNSQEAARTMFVTTTCRGFAKVLRRDEIKAILMRRLVSDSHRYGAVIHAFCVMDHHVHLIVRSPMTGNISTFMKFFKKHACDDILPHLDAYETFILDKHRDKEGHRLWMRSFKSKAMKDEDMFWACVRYIHLNPTRAALCERTIDYAWSSARLFEDCAWREETGIMEGIGEWE